MLPALGTAQYRRGTQTAARADKPVLGSCAKPTVLQPLETDLADHVSPQPAKAVLTTAHVTLPPSPGH